ncbi:carbohydrate ABC transporter permease [Dactylosporangium sp. CA-092794]|uniref:carbohydrate ABC transporter permease n=1 Tax=Dactylosporangium sp. CA-092794 TaxID=3239929 RepID=UPI003D8A80A0
MSPKSRARTVNILLSISATVIALAVLLPVIWMVFASLRPDADILRFPPTILPRQWSLDSYQQVFTQIPFARLYANSVIFAGVVTVVSLLLDSMAGYALARLKFRGSTVVLVVVLVMLMMPIQVTLVPLYDVMRHLGLVDTLPGLIVPRISNAFGIFFMRQFFLSLPGDLEDAGRVDGAGEFRIFSRLVLPLTRPALLTLGLFQFQGNWNDLIWPLVMTNNIENGTLPAGLALFAGQNSTQYSLVMAGSVLALLPIVVMFLLVQRSFVESVATTGFR